MIWAISSASLSNERGALPSALLLAVIQTLRPALKAAAAMRARMRRVSPSRGLARAIRDGFGADACGEDRFDSVIGLLGLIGVLDGARPDSVPEDPWIRNWEGWVLGQTAMPASQEGPCTAGGTTFSSGARQRGASGKPQ